jgi:hypothetical protein
MLVKFLGILDIFIAIAFWIFAVFNILPEKFIMALGIILLIKGVVFVLGLSVASIIDIICALVIIIASSTQVPHTVNIIVALFLFQKGLFSLAS